MAENLTIELPFAALTDLDLIDASPVGVEVPTYDSYSSMYFLSEDHADKFDSDINPANICQNLSVLCKYYDFDENLLKAMARRNYGSLTIVSFNICSVAKHLDEFVGDFNNFNIDIIALCETRLSKDIECLYKLTGYEMHCNSRNCQGGGVLFYVKAHLASELLHQFTFMTAHVETIFVRFSVGARRYIVGNFYRPPGATVELFNTTVDEILREILSRFDSSYVMLVGDFNIDLFKVGRFSRYFDFYALMTSYGYTPLTLRPTRVTTQSFSLIDQIWTNVSDHVETSGVILSELSDHYPVFSRVKTGGYSKNEKYVDFKFRLNNSDCHGKFRDSIMPILEWNLDETSNVQTLYDDFTNFISNAYNSAYPMIEVKKKKLDVSKPYITNELKCLIREKHKLKKLFHRFPYTYGTRYRAIRNKVCRMADLNKKTFLQSEIVANKNNAKKTFEIINEALGRNKKVSSSIEMSVNGEVLTDDLHKANAFNDYFTSIGETLAEAFSNQSNFRQYLPDENKPDCIFKFSSVSLNELDVIIRDLKPTSPGCDEIPIRIFKDNMDIFGNIILHICNQSLLQGIFPAQLKRAKVVPIFKTGDRKELKNYRPISILNSFSKILEKLAHLQLYSYLTENNILSSSQFGFRSGLSTDNAVNSMSRSIYEAMDKREFSVCIMIDLSKAFDTLDRNMLLNKLKYYGISNNSLLWFQSYLSERDQFVMLNGIASNCSKVDLGVAQGSSLGPLLFILFINDLTQSSRFFEFFLYADDTSLVASSQDLNSLIVQINSELEKVHEWFQSNHLTVNVNKTNCLIFRRRLQIVGNVEPIRMNGEILKIVSSCRFLGIHIDKHLNFDTHIKFVVSKVSKYIFILYKIKKYFDRRSLVQIYHTLVYPNITYGITAWGNVGAVRLKPMNVCLNKIVRSICGAHQRTSAAPLYASLGFFDLKHIYRYMLGNYVHKIQLRSDAVNRFSLSLENYDTRQSRLQLLHIPRALSSHSEQSVDISGPRNYNTIPVNVRSIVLYDSFKYNYKKYLLSLRSYAH